jgi:hypothetical protein
MREREVSDALRLEEEEHHAAVVGTMHRHGRSACRGDSRKRPRSGANERSDRAGALAGRRWLTESRGSRAR